MPRVPYRYVALNISQQTPKLSQDLSDMSSKLSGDKATWHLGLNLDLCKLYTSQIWHVMN
jgi:hypothetical protein